MKLDQELMSKIKKCKSKEELKDLASNNKFSLTDKEVDNVFLTYCQESGELSDDELDNVSGGHWRGEYCDSGSTPLFPVGTRVKRDHYLYFWTVRAVSSQTWKTDSDTIIAFQYKYDIESQTNIMAYGVYEYELSNEEVF